MKIAVSIEPRDAVTLHAWAEAALRLPNITDLQRTATATAACSARTASKTIVGRSRRRRSGTVAA
jgi:hypothetical protein